MALTRPVGGPLWTGFGYFAAGFSEFFSKLVNISAFALLCYLDIFLRVRGEG